MLECAHEGQEFLTPPVLAAVGAQHAKSGRRALHTSAWVGHRNVAFGLGTQPLDTCAHLVISLGAPAGYEPEGGLAGLATEVFAVEFGKLEWQERYTPCPDCLTSGCPTCGRIGWKREQWSDVTIGAPGWLLSEVLDATWSGLRGRLPRGFRTLADGLRRS